MATKKPVAPKKPTKPKKAVATKKAAKKVVAKKAVKPRAPRAPKPVLLVEAPVTEVTQVAALLDEPSPFTAEELMAAVEPYIVSIDPITGWFRWSDGTVSEPEPEPVAFEDAEAAPSRWARFKNWLKS